MPDDTALALPYSRLSRLLPAAKALKYLQLERQLSTLLRYELAATAPLAP